MKLHKKRSLSYALMIVLASIVQLVSPASSHAAISSPTVTSISPTSGSASGETLVTITGTGFAAGATVFFGMSTPCTSITVVSATSITCRTPAAPPGPSSVNVKMSNSDSGASNVLSSAFTYDAPVVNPTISTVTPSTGSTSGGTLITIIGTRFASGAAVTIGGTSCVGITVDSATSITCTTPAGSAGAKNVVVTNSDTGAATKSSGFTYEAPADDPAPAPAPNPETVRAGCQSQLFAAFKNNETPMLTSYICADIQGVTNSNYIFISAEAMKLGNDLPALISVVRKFVVIEKLSNPISSARVYARDLVEIGLMKDTDSHKSAITRAIRNLPASEIDTYEEVRVAIGREKATYQMRKDRLAQVLKR